MNLVFLAGSHLGPASQKQPETETARGHMSGWCLVPSSEWMFWAPLTSNRHPFVTPGVWFWVFRFRGFPDMSGTLSGTRRDPELFLGWDGGSLQARQFLMGRIHGKTPDFAPPGLPPNL